MAPWTIRTLLGGQLQLPAVVLKLRTSLMQVQLLEAGAAFPKALMDALQARHLMLVALEPMMISEVTSGQAQYPWGYQLSAFEMQVH